MMWSSQVSRPVETLAAFADRLSRGEWEEPLTLHSVGELQMLVQSLERMRGDLLRYRDQLVIGERHAAWSQMARQVAHEVKNPLTPIAISIADLKRSFDQQRPDFPMVLDQAVHTVGHEVHELKRLLDQFSELGRFPTPVFAPCDVTELFRDLEALYSRDVAEGRLVLDPGSSGAVIADAGQLRQALVNLIKNGLEALDGAGRVTLAARPRDEDLEITVTDTGPGLSPEQRAHLFVPGFTTKTSGSGLGLTIVERIVHDHGGTIVADAAPDRGTLFRIHLPRKTRS
jgi:nitrogen fixation/metabolism regulation signal transduction histidine kinase